MGKTRFTAAPGIEVAVSRLPGVQRWVSEAAGELHDAIRAGAPDGGIWLSARDERVRYSHVEADGQIIPDNLRYILEKADGGPGVDMARVPRDPDLPLPNRINCRCAAATLPGAVARSVHRDDLRTARGRVSCQIYTEFPRVVESEFPDHPDGGGGWMGQAVDEVAARLRARSRGTLA